MKRLGLAVAFGFALLAVPGDRSVRSQPEVVALARRPPYGLVLDHRMKEFGHRNWIIIADAAYPSSARPGIETVVTADSQLDVLKLLVDTLGQAKHLRASVWLDAEMEHVPEADAKGMNRYRLDLKKSLGPFKPSTQPHAQLLARVDAVAEKYKVLVLKTEQMLPYTSVFIELECGYWTPEAEQRLRESMKAKQMENEKKEKKDEE